MDGNIDPFINAYLSMDAEAQKGKKLRMTRVRVPGKEVCMAHIISRSDEVIYQNLGLQMCIRDRN